MSNIIKLDSNALISHKRDLIAKYGETSAKIIWSRQNEEKALNQTVPKLSLEINKFIASAYAILGQNIDDSQILMTCKIFSEEIKRYHSNLTITEIGIAIDQGAKHSDDNYISVKNLLKWVKTYTETTRQKALIAHKEQTEKEEEGKKEEMNKQENESFMIGIEKLYQDYLNGYDLENENVFIKAVSYARIEKEEVFTVSTQLKKEMYQKEFEKLPQPERGQLDLRDNECKVNCRAKCLKIAFEFLEFNEFKKVFNND